MSCQGRMGEMSDMPRGCGSVAGTIAGGGMMHGDVELGPAQGESLMEAGEVEEPLSTYSSRKSAIISQFESKALGLDKAILHSIDCCGKEVNGAVKQKTIFCKKLVPIQVLRGVSLKRNQRESVLFPPSPPTGSDETKRKMYSSILVVGGGLMFHGAQEFLLHRIINKMPPSFRRLVDNVEVITRPKVTQVVVSIKIGFVFKLPVVGLVLSAA